ncbi:Crp/Fnr family transcriptional regulator [Amycolatopsis sp. NBC_00438]|uniref:Crp/Fnr family transcriptional regulator n=1 Tax=Amycolatopsis sp. NBC_00438 TaxID=2903558 RepID=UPI002E211B67
MPSSHSSDAQSWDVIQQLPVQDYKTLRRAGRMIECRGGTKICNQGELDAPVYFLRTGIVKVSRTALPGSPEMIVDVSGAGDILGAEACLRNKQSHVSLTATKDVTALEVPRVAFLQFLERHPKAALLLMAAIAERGRVRDATLAFAAHKVHDRLLAFLYRQAQRHGTEDDSHAVTIDIGFRLVDVAAAIGGSVASVSTELERFKADGLIETGYKSMKVPKQVFRDHRKLLKAEPYFIDDVGEGQQR